MDKHMYINGARHRIEWTERGFYADSTQLPHRRCSYHNVGQDARLMLERGLVVRTLGNTYCIYPPMTSGTDPDTGLTLPTPKRQTVRQYLTKLWLALCGKA